MDSSVLSLLGCEFSGASYGQKVKLIEQAMARVLVSQESEINSNRNKRADMKALQEMHQYFNHLAINAQNPTQVLQQELERR
jgi:hypothetical protein